MKNLKLFFKYFQLVFIEHSGIIFKFILINPSHLKIGIKIFFNYLRFMIFQNLRLKKKNFKIKNEFINFMNEHLNFTDDWFSNNIHVWIDIFKSNNFLKNKINILEIGSYEGVSAAFLLKHIPNSRIDCVETFLGSDEHGAKDFNTIEKNFNKNLSLFEKRFSLFKMTSDKFFLKKENEKQSNNYDLIYVDGSHKYEDVFKDALNSMKFLNNGGIIIFDDFLRVYYKDFNKNPIKAIADFIKTYENRIIIILVNYQLIIKKKYG